MSVYEYYKRSPTIKAITRKLFITIGGFLIFFTIPGVRIPFQFPMKFAYTKLRFFHAQRIYMMDRTEKSLQRLLRTAQNVIRYMEFNDMLERRTVVYILNVLTLAMEQSDTTVFLITISSAKS